MSIIQHLKLFFRLVSHLCHDPGNFTPVDDVYQAYVKDATRVPESKKSLSMLINQLFPKSSPSHKRYGKTLKRGYRGIVMDDKKTDDQNCNTSFIELEDRRLVATQYVKDNNPVVFTVHTTHAMTISIFGQDISTIDLGVGANTPFDTIARILQNTKICRGYPGTKHKWEFVRGGNVFWGDSSKTCKLILNPAQTFCSSCKNHAKYIKGKTENITGKENLPPGTARDTSAETTAEPSAPSDDSSPSTPDLIADMDAILKALGTPDDRASIMLDAAKNEGATHKSQRRWSLW